MLFLLSSIDLIFQLNFDISILSLVVDMLYLKIPNIQGEIKDTKNQWTFRFSFFIVNKSHDDA